MAGPELGIKRRAVTVLVTIAFDPILTVRFRKNYVDGATRALDERIY